VLLMTADEAARRGLTPLARIASYATAGLDPSIMGVGPIHASRKALAKAGWKPADLDLVEANEAFAAQACAVNKDMGWNPEVVNVNGGAIAIGHPIGASGARILNTLLFEMQRRGAKKGLATLCIGGGMGVAMCLERLNRSGNSGNDGRNIVARPSFSDITRFQITPEGGTSWDGLHWSPAARAGSARRSVALKAAGYTVAANYAGNDEAAAKFTAETGIKTYKWNVADYEPSKAGIAQVEADLGPIDRDRQCRASPATRRSTR
jgi:hypothetical protein